jgi:CBS-domain-containing membrane protein
VVIFWFGSPLMVQSEGGTMVIGFVLEASPLSSFTTILFGPHLSASVSVTVMGAGIPTIAMRLSVGCASTVVMPRSTV